MTPADRLAAFCAARRIAHARPFGELGLGYQFDRKGNRIDLTVGDIEAILADNARLRTEAASTAAQRDAQHALDQQQADVRKLSAKRRALIVGGRR